MYNEVIKLLKDEFKSKNPQHFKKNEIIFFEKQNCEYISIVLKGTIYMSSFYQNHEIKFNYMGINSIFGHNLIFSKDNKYHGNIIALDNVELLNITKQEFLKSLQNPTILDKYLTFLSEQTLKDKEAIKLLKIVTLEERILYLISSHNNKLRIRSISDLSNTLNVSRETLSRCIAKLCKNNIIRKDGNYLILL